MVNRAVIGWETMELATSLKWYLFRLPMEKYYLFLHGDPLSIHSPSSKLAIKSFRCTTESSTGTCN